MCIVLLTATIPSLHKLKTFPQNSCLFIVAGFETRFLSVQVSWTIFYRHVKLLFTQSFQELNSAMRRNQFCKTNFIFKRKRDWWQNKNLKNDFRFFWNHFLTELKDLNSFGIFINIKSEDCNTGRFLYTCYF